MGRLFRLPENGRFTNKDILTLMIPLIIEQLLVVLVGMADTAMVSAVGEEAVSGVSLVDAINVLVLQVFMALTAGGGVVIAQYIGNREIKNARASAKQLIYISLLFALGIMAVFLLFDDVVLGLMFGGVSEGIMNNARIYFIYSAVSYPFIAVYNGCAAVFRVMGNGRVPLVGSLLMNVINITFNAIFIFGYGMGVAGAAIATLMSRVAACLLLLVLVCRKTNLVYIDKIYKYRPDGAMIARMLKTGLPNSVESGMFQLGRLILQRFISTLGTASIAANAVAMSVASFSNVAGSATTTGMLTVVGQCMGAGEKEDAVIYTKHIMKLTYVVSFAMTAVLAAFNETVVALFNLGEESARLTLTLLYLYYIFEVLIWPLSFTLPGAFRASGDNRFTMIVSLLSMWLCRIVLGYILGKFAGLGILGVWIAMIIDWAVRSVIFIWRFMHREKWQNIKVI